MNHTSVTTDAPTAALERAGLVRVDLPIPDPRLGKSARPQFWTHRRIYNQHREDAGWAIHEAMFGSPDAPWPGAVMDIHWRHCYGVEPDDDGVIVRCAAYRDGAQDACLVLNDKAIRVGVVTFAKVKKRDVGVTLSFLHLRRPCHGARGARGEVVMAIRPISEKPVNLGVAGPVIYAPPEPPMTFIVEAAPRCDGCGKRGVNQRPAGWLMLVTTTHLHWFCSWGCLRDYCNATVVDTPPTSPARLAVAQTSEEMTQ